MAAGLPSRRLLAAAKKGAVVWAISLFVTLSGVIGFYGADALAASLPGGASSLQETYQNWQVRCVSQEDDAVCRLVQRQVHRDTGQLLLALEFMTTDSGRLSGTIAMPFGLRLGAGVTLQVDDGEPTPPLPFSTCLPGGCLVPVTPDEAVTAQLRAGENLRLVAQLLDGQPIQFSVSLNGFAAALDRLQDLQATM